MPRSATLLRSLGIAAGVALPLALLAPPAPLAAQAARAAAAPSADPVTQDPPRDAAHPPRLEELEITSAGDRLNAVMYVAPGAGPRPTVLLLHGFPGNERNLDLAQAMRRAGMNVLFFSYRGAWGSGGTFSFANARQDVAAALRFVRSPESVARFGTDPRRVALVGHSMGAWLSFLGAVDDSTVRCVGGIEVGDMALGGRMAAQSPRADSEFTAYAGWLTRPGAPLHADGAALVASLKANATPWSLPANAPALAGRTLLVLDNDHNRNHAELVAALRRAGARQLTEEVWRDTDHSFSDRRIALARRVVGWLQSSCGY